MAAVDYFLKLDGIKGESTDDKHKDEIDVLSFSWGATQTGTMAQGGGAGAGKVSMQDFKFTMKVSKASPTLFLACASGQHIKSATVIGRASSGPVVEIASNALASQENSRDFLKLSFSDILVSSYQEGGSGTDVFDNASLRYATVKYEGVPGARVAVTPQSAGMLAFDPKTGQVVVTQSEGGMLMSGPGDEREGGGFTRGVAEYSLADITPVLGGPVPCALTLSVREVRQPQDTTGGEPPEAPDEVRRTPPGLQKKVGRHDLYWYPGDLELTADDFARKGRRLGSVHVDPSDPNAAAASFDLCDIVKENGLDAIGIRIQSAMDHSAPSEDEQEEGSEEGSDSGGGGPPFVVSPALFLVDLTLEMQ